MADHSPSSLHDYLNSLAEWNDEQKKLSLFSPLYFRSTDEDPITRDSLEGKYQFWANLLHFTSGKGWLSDHHIFLIDGALALSTIQRNGVYPLGLEAVLKEMARRGELVEENQLLGQSKSSPLRWIANTLIFPLSFLKRQLYKHLATDDEDLSPETRRSSIAYVSLKTMKMVVGALKKQMSHSRCDLVENVLPFHEFQIITEKVAQELGLASPSSRDLDILLHYMHLYESHIGVLNPNSLDSRQKVIIFSMGVPIQDISAHDVILSVARMKTGISQVENRISTLEQLLQRVDGKMRNYLFQQKNRQAAVILLKRKKTLMDNHANLHSSLLNLQVLLDRIRHALDNEHILQAYQSGGAALRSILSREIFSKDSVDAIMDDTAEQLDRLQEIDVAMQTIDLPNQTLNDEEADILEQELASLQEEESKIEQTRRTQQLLESLDALSLESLPQLKKSNNTDRQRNQEIDEQTEKNPVVSLPAE